MGEEPEVWRDVDQFITERLIGDDPVLEEVVRQSEAAGLPPIRVSPPQGMHLALLAAAVGANRVLELGTLGGYSTIWLCRGMALSGGDRTRQRLITVEARADFAAVAKANISAAGLDDIVEVRVGDARDVLARLHDERDTVFDLAFIDADKVHSPDYFTWAVEHSRPGALIVVDNVVRQGALADRQTRDSVERAQRRLHELAGADRRLHATTIQTVGAKGYDGFLIAWRKRCGARRNERSKV